jgi:GT2 family glycosyltransferase
MHCDGINDPLVSVCVLCYGDHLELVQRSLASVLRYCPESQCRVIVGANAPSKRLAGFVRELSVAGRLHDLIISETNLNKCPMMRRMFDKVRTEFIWWFDDDSYITEPSAVAIWLDHAVNSPPETVMWGQLNWCDSTIGFCHFNERATLGFVRAASWYRGLPPPSWRPGGKGDFNFRGGGTGDGRWNYLAGGCWMIRTTAVRALDWPDPRLVKMGDDTFLGEAIRQQGWEIMDNGSPGVAINTAPRRGDPG